MKKVALLGLCLFFYLENTLALPIHDAITQNNIDLVKDLLNENPELLEMKDESGLSPLNLAAYKGSQEIVKYLSEKGADLYSGDTEGSIPLHNSAAANNLSIVKYLVEEKQTNVNFKDNNGSTALIFSAGRGYPEIVEFLLKNGADVNIQSNNGSTALHSAAYYNRLQCLELMLEKTNNLEIENNWKFTPFLSAAAGGKLEAVKLLVSKGANIKAMNSNEWNALIYACHNQNIELAEYLLLKGLDVNFSTTQNETALSRALWHANVDLTKLLLDNSANVDAPAMYGVTQLYFAGAYRSQDIADLMMPKGRNFSVKNDFNQTMLHFAAARGFTDQIKILLSKGVNVNDKDNNGNTALYYARLWKHQPVIDLLLKNGAETTIEKTNLEGEYLGYEKPGRNPLIFAEDQLITPFSPHGAIAISPDGNEIFWCHQAMPIQAMWHIKQKNGVWTEPEIAPFTDPDLDYKAGNPRFSPDGKKLYYHSHRPLNSVESKEDADIWFVEKIGNSWSEPVNLGSVINTDLDEINPSVSRNGNLYFIGSDYEDSFGTGDIYVSKWIDGKFTTPQNLGANVNSDKHEISPVIAPDESYILFASDRPNPHGGLNIFVSFKTISDGWTEAFALGSHINEGQAWHPFITAEGKYIFYLKGDNYYWVSSDIIADLKELILESDPKLDVSFTRSDQDFGEGSTREIILEDFDSDNDLDAVFSMGQVWLNNGKGYFEMKYDNLIQGGHGLDVGDLDNDGDKDVIFAGDPNTIYLNDGSANLSKSDQYCGDRAFDINIIDYNSDGWDDLIINFGRDSTATYYNNGDGTFQLSKEKVYHKKYVDMDNDGDLDLFLRERQSGLRTLKNENNKFNEYWSLSDSTLDYGFCEFADLDNDGDQDVLITNGGNDNIYQTLQLMNDGTGRFTIIDKTLPRTRWGNVACGDLNNDGFIDAVLTNFTLPNLILLNDGKGKLLDSGLRLGGNSGTMISAVGDLDNDGDQDIFFSSFDGGKCEIWFNDLIKE
ncbi:ankyrin repeat domain-containing protein [Candidatus Cloacimonadota bacterium]